MSIYQSLFLSVHPHCKNSRVPLLTLLAVPRKNEEPDSATGLNAKDDELPSSMKFLLLSVGSETNA